MKTNILKGTDFILPHLKRAFLFAGMMLLFLEDPASAEGRIEAQFSGTIDSQMVTVEHFRPRWLCGHVFNKPDHIKDYGVQSLPLLGGVKTFLSTKDEVWTSNSTSPFSTETRRLILSTKITEDAQQFHVDLLLKDQYAHHGTTYKDRGCDWMEGRTYPRQATLEGALRIFYKVPSNVWLLKVERSAFNGLFRNQSLLKVSSAISDEKSNLSNQTFYVWVQPNSEISLDLGFPAEVLGTQDLFHFSYSLQPISGTPVNFEAFNKTLDHVESIQDSSLSLNEAKTLLETLMGTISRGEELSKEIAHWDIAKSIELSDRVFKLANGRINNPELSLSIKAAAALSAYQISVGLLKELSSYCREIETLSPYSHGTIKATQLRLSTFWLKHILVLLRSNPFSQYESLLEELKELQNVGLSWQHLGPLKAQKQKLQAAFKLISNYAPLATSSIDRILLGAQRFIEAAKGQGISTDFSELVVHRISEQQLMERGFVLQFQDLATLFQDRDPNPIDVTAQIHALEVLKSGRKSIEDIIKANTRLISVSLPENPEDLFTKMNRLLSYQVGLMTQPIARVPFFASLQVEFLKTYQSDELIKFIEACIAGEAL